ESEDLAGRIAPQNQRDLEARRGHQPSAADQVAPQYRIPESPKKLVLAALRRARDANLDGLLHYSVRPMITAIIYGRPALPNSAGCVLALTGEFRAPRGYGMLSGHA